MKKIILFTLLLGFVSQNVVKAGIASKTVAGLAGLTTAYLLPTESQQTIIQNFFTKCVNDKVLNKIQGNVFGNKIAQLYKGQTTANYANVCSSLLVGYLTYKSVKCVINKIDGTDKKK